MNYSEKLLKEQLNKLNHLYDKFVNKGSVKEDSKVALQNRKDAKDIENSLLILSGVVKQSELFTCKLKGGKECCSFKSKDYMACVQLRKCEFASI